VEFHDYLTYEQKYFWSIIIFCLKFATLVMKNNKNIQMKKILTFTILGAVLSLVIASCSTSTAGHCDAYGSIQTTPKSDLASK
jgi:ABC-type enterochelin transport system permease subunit